MWKKHILLCKYSTEYFIPMHVLYNNIHYNSHLLVFNCGSFSKTIPMFPEYYNIMIVKVCSLVILLCFYHFIYLRQFIRIHLNLIEIYLSIFLNIIVNMTYTIELVTCKVTFNCFLFDVIKTKPK